MKTADPAFTRSRSLLKPDLIEVFSLLSLALIVGYQLLVSPIIGIADNGDFGRIIQSTGLEHVHAEYADKYFLYVNSTYKITPPNETAIEYQSSTGLFVKLARSANISLIDGQVFDIRMLGIIYLILFLLAVYLALVASRSLRLNSRVLLASLIAFMLTDAGYVAFFNSFYSEPTGLTCLLLAVGCALPVVTRQSTTLLLLVGYFTAAAALVTSKPMYVPFAFPLGLFGLYLSGLITFDHRYKLGIGMACALCMLALWYQGQTPDWLRRNSNYVGIFMDMLPHSETREQDLLLLGLDPNWTQYTGVNAWAPESPIYNLEFRTEFEARVTTISLPLFYLKQPQRLFSLIQRCARNMLITHIDYLGYYDKSSGKPPRAKPPGLWPDIRDFVFPKNIWFLGGFLLVGMLATIVGIIRRREHRGLFFVYCMLLAVAATQFLIPSLILGEHDLGRHLLLFNIIFDLSLIVSLVFIVQTAHHHYWTHPAELPIKERAQVLK